MSQHSSEFGTKRAMNQILVSVVLVTYNRPPVLKDTISDLLSQSHQNIELIICDDASSDSMTKAICEEVESNDSRVRYVRQVSNVGMPANLNSGIKIARGKYLAITHDADRYDTDLIESWLGAMEKCEKSLFVFNHYAVVNNFGDVTHTHTEDLQACNPGAVILQEFYRRWHFDSPVWGTVMVLREAVVEMGLFDVQYGFYADVDMWLRLSELGNVAYVNRPIIKLADRVTWPNNFSIESSTSRKIVRLMFLNSRIRYFRKRPVRQKFELIRHFIFCYLDDAYHLILGVRRSIIRLVLVKKS